MISRAEIREMWNSISGNEDLQTILERSAKHPQLIYKHSPSCSVSFIAKQELDSNVQELNKSVDLYLVNVIQERAVSNMVAQELGIRHESPQVILLKDGKVVWEGSHWQVKGEEILAGLDSIVSRSGI